MSTNNTDTAKSPFLPLLLVAATLLIVLGAQLWASLFRERPALQQQEAQMAQIVNNAATLQNIRNGLCQDLLALSKTDSDAKALVQKLGIKYTPPPAGAASK